MRPENRAVSTVVDVALALLLVTASIATMVVFLGEDDQPTETRNPDELAQTLSATTITAEYSLESLENSDQFEDEEYYEYSRRNHGTAVELVADATVRSVTFDTPGDRTPLNEGSEPYVEAVEAGVNERVTGTNENAHVVALWRPYNRSDIQGRIEAGPTPPGDADVSTTTIRVDSGMDRLTDARIERAYDRGGKRAVATLVAETIVDGQFPPTATQLAIEKRGFQGSLARYRYKRMRNILQSYPETSSFKYSTGPYGAPVYERDVADAAQANEEVVDELEEIVLEELDDKYFDEMDTVTGQTLADAIQTGHVVVVVRTW
ncbi:hypothetical protein G9C85_04675 [Halorubellus sp. JP-L1]|uniref:DUF7284 family protein n=1 Tax=Halorubellus sp. JP-L1 TaxID=2715753 RepID=UPI0014081017|nr:hypothetical protein [Halorubellus sp. JP-L1]NHN40930.1 hypothetical protein [Halorubellus sp. JP-L1]